MTGRAFLWLIGKIIIIRDWNNLKFKSPERMKERSFHSHLSQQHENNKKCYCYLLSLHCSNIHTFIEIHIHRCYKISYEIEFPFWKPALLRLNFNLNIWKHKSGIYCYFLQHWVPVEMWNECLSLIPHTHSSNLFIYFVFLFSGWGRVKGKGIQREKLLLI